MNKPTTTIYLLLFCVFTFSCGSDFYIPRQSNLIILEEKKDVKISVSYSQLQAAYSPINNIGIKADYSFVSNASARRERDLRMGNIGLGYYKNKIVKPLIRTKKKLQAHPKLCLIGFEVFGNFAAGNIATQRNPTNSFFLFFEQPEGLRTFDAKLINPNLSAQVYWQTQSLSLHFGARYGLLTYYEGFGFGDYTEQERELASSLIQDSPLNDLVFDLMLSNGNDRLETFAQLTWNESSRIFFDNKATFSFGIKLNIPSFLEGLKSR